MPNEIQDSNQLQNIREPETPILKKRLYKKNKQNGQLKIGDHWNAITIIALSQSSPLKAVAEFVENSIDAQATQIIIYRGKESGEYYLKIVDNGNGIPRNDQGQPNFQYVATHICDSIKRQLKAKSTLGVQGEFGIGLLSFWTVGEELIIRSVGNDNKIYQMNLKKGNPKYEVTQSRSLFLPSGTELIVRPLLKGLKQLNGEKLQWYLASELRNRILKTGVDIRIIDRVSRAEFKVEPKKYDGRKLGFTETTELKAAKIQFELYLNEPNPENKIALYRMGTRVLESITEFDFFQKSPWNLGFIQGYIDAPLLQLSPANRLGIIRDEAFETFCDSLKTIEEQLEKEIQAQKKAEDEKATHDTLSAIQKALKEAMLSLPPEEYDWFDMYKQKPTPAWQKEQITEHTTSPDTESSISESFLEDDQKQKSFFDFPGPLFSVKIYPASNLVSVNTQKNLRAVTKDKKNKPVHEKLNFSWQILEGQGSLLSTNSEIVNFHAPNEPGLIKIGLTASQELLSGEKITCISEAILTITDSLIAQKNSSEKTKGLPGYTFQKAPGALWRSKYDSDKNLIIINNGHKDFVFSSQNKTLKLRYLCRLFAKELVKINFPGCSTDELLERLIEVSLYTEERLK